MEDGVKVMPKAIVCEDSVLRGDIWISSGSVIHTSANIIAEAGPIIIGENCIVEEYATIHNRKTSDDSKAETMVIGNNNVFEARCSVGCRKIGSNNVFENMCQVAPEVEVTNGCVIGAGCQLSGPQSVLENTVVYGNRCLRREFAEKQMSQLLQLDSLRKILPNYHHVKKVNSDAKKNRTLM